MKVVGDKDEVTHDSDEEIKAILPPVWVRTTRFLRLKAIRVFDNPSNDTHFSDGYIERIGGQWRNLQRLDFRVSLLLLATLCFLWALDSGALSGVSIFNIQIRAESLPLIVPVVLASALIVASSILSLMEAKYKTVITAYAETRLEDSDDALQLYVLQFAWWRNSSVFDSFDDPEDTLSPSFTVAALSFVLLAAITYMDITLTLFQGYIFFSSVIRVFDDPDLSTFATAMVVVFAVTSICFAIAIYWISELPLPYRSLANLKYLESLDDTDPERSARVGETILPHEEKRDRRKNAAIALFWFIGTMIALDLIWVGWDFFSNYSGLVPIAVSSLIFAILGVPLLDQFVQFISRKTQSTDLAADGARLENFRRRKQTSRKVRAVSSVFLGAFAFACIELA